MSAVSVIAGTVIAALAVVSLYRVLRLPLPRRVRFFLAGIRIVIFSLIAAAFFEPVLVFERILPARRPVPVFIDVSRSMRLFQPSNSVLPALRAFEEWNARHAGDGRRFVFYCFGDSLRPQGRPMNGADPFADRRSYLPATMKDQTIRRASAAIIVSDGNWSNALLPLGNFSDKNIWYLPLPPAVRQPFLRAGLAAFPETAPADSMLNVAVVVEGVAGADDTVVVTAFEANERIARERLAVPAGPFDRRASLVIGKRTPGRHAYRFEAQSLGTGEYNAVHAVATATPRHFTFAMGDAPASLDRRFIELAFRNDPLFTETTTTSPTPLDLLVLLDWNDKNAQAIRTAVRPNGAVLFAGSLPCAPAATATIPATAAMRLIHTGGGNGPDPFGDFDVRGLPPPSAVLACSDKKLRSPSPVLAAVLPAGLSSGRPSAKAAADTVPVLYTGYISGRRYLACPVKGLWRWDFLPLAVQAAEERAFGFSARLAAAAKELLTNGLADRMLLSPAGPLMETDSLFIRALFPVDLPLPADIRMTCSFTSRGSRFDTSFNLAGNGPSGSLHFGPLRAGRYRFTAEGIAGGRRYVFADTLTVNPDRSEDVIAGQNVPLLREIAQPLETINDSVLAATVFGAASGPNGRVRETFPVRRTWPLLLLLFAAFATEWITRRAVKLD